MSKYDPAEYQRNKAKYRARSLRWQTNNPDKQRAAARKCRYKDAPTRPEPEWCELCGRSSERSLCFDHDHITGKFRGWLCGQCNRSLGQLGDNVESVQRALDYLKRTT